MRAKYKYPNGTGVIQMKDDATVEDVYKAIESGTSIDHFTIKYGPPSAMKTIQKDQLNALAVSLGLHGQTLTIVPLETESTFVPGLVPKPSFADGEVHVPGNITSDSDPGDVLVSWPEREGVLLLRVMPSDNSCLFTAFGGSLPQQIPAAELRGMMAQYISKHPDVYNEAILGCSSQAYQRNIRDPDRWGGGIELSILSTIFDVQICTFDVQSQQLISFGEDKASRCVLVYSGIHYDRVAFSYTEYPHNTASLPPEMDRSLWPTDDSEVLEQAAKLVQKLNASHYYTNTESLVLKCNEIGCDWIGSGQSAAKIHAQSTGHVSVTEIPDTG